MLHTQGFPQLPAFVHEVMATAASYPASGSLDASWSAGEKFLADPASTIASGACLRLSSFWANLQQHLTNLKLELQPGKGNTQLESLGSLTALKSLMIMPEGPYRPGPPRYDMSEAKLVLEMPNLEFLFVCSLSNGECSVRSRSGACMVHQ